MNNTFRDQSNMRSNRIQPATRYRVDTALVLIGALALVCSSTMLFLSPELFLLVLMLILLSLSIFTYGFLSILASPPNGLMVGIVVFTYCMIDFSVRRGTVPTGGLDVQSVTKGILWFVVLLFGTAHGLRAVFQNSILVTFFAYAVFGLISAFYSPTLFLGLGGGVALLAISTYAGAISQWPIERLANLWRQLFVALSSMGTISLVLYFALPDWARDFKSAGAGRLAGLAGSGNSLGPLMAIAIITGLFCIRTASRTYSKFLYCFLVAIDASTLALTQSRSSAIALFGGLLFVATIGRPLLISGFVVVGAVASWAALQPDIIPAALEFLAQWLSRSGDIHEVASLTGRSEIWTAVIGIWLRSPWIGFGLGSPRTVIPESNISHWQTFESAHNWLLESLLSVGIVGVAFLSTFLALLAFRLLRKYRPTVPHCKSFAVIDEHLWRCLAQAFAFALLGGITEKSFGGIPAPTTLLLGMIAGSCVAMTRSSRAEQAAQLAASGEVAQPPKPAPAKNGGAW